MPNLTSHGATEHLLISPPPHASLSAASPLSPSASPQLTINSDFKLYKRRYFVLFLFSSLAFLNNVVCYTFASISHIAKPQYPNMSLSSLVSYFFITYTLFSFPSSLFINRFSLRSGIILGASLQALGTYLRYYDRSDPNPGGWWCWLRVGQLVASLGQAFFVNPPPTMAATWFGSEERVLATTIGVNANTLGIAGAYILGAVMVRSPADIDNYLFIIFLLSLVFAILVIFFYPSAPPTPPSFSAYHSHKHPHSPTVSQFSVHSLLKLFRYTGFLHTCLAFALAEATINALSAFFTDILIPEGYSATFVGVNATSFIIFCMIGSAIVGYVVDRTHCYTVAVCLCFIIAALSLLTFTYYSADSAVLTCLLIVVLGFTLGPVQPLVIETGVEVTYPSPASTVAAVQQVLGNVLSAIMFPLFGLMEKSREGGMHAVLLSVSAVLGGMGLLYATFRGEYRRLRHETLGVLDRRDSENPAVVVVDKRLEMDKSGGGIGQLDEHHVLLTRPAGNGVSLTQYGSVR